MGGGVTSFSKLRNSSEFLDMRFKSCLFFVLFLKRFIHFLKISKILFAVQNGVLKFAFETHVHRVLLKIIHALTNFTSNRNSVKNFKQGFTWRFNFAPQAPTISLRGQVLTPTVRREAPSLCYYLQLGLAVLLIFFLGPPCSHDSLFLKFSLFCFC